MNSPIPSLTYSLITHLLTYSLIYTEQALIALSKTNPDAIWMLITAIHPTKHTQLHIQDTYSIATNVARLDNILDSCNKNVL